LISDHELAFSSRILLIFLPAENPFFACGTFSLPQGHKPRTPNTKKSMLGRQYYLFHGQPRQQSIYQPEQPAQQHSSQQYQQQVPVLAQELAAAASYYQPSAAATAQSTKKCHRKQQAASSKHRRYRCFAEMHASRIWSCAHQPH
jgi:hypothetical protein